MDIKSYRYLLTGFFTIFFLTGAILSCSSSGSGSSSPGAAPATVPAVVFIADKDSNEVFELYVSLDDGATVLKLSGTMVLNGDVRDFKISPDGTRVAYRADQDIDGAIELYVNSINGGTPIKVHPDFPFGRNVELLPALPPNNLDIYSWSPDGSMIAYIADQASDTVYELFVSSPDGILNFKVSGSLVGNGDLIDFEWAPDNSRIAYRADEDSVGVYELYTTTPSATPTFNKVSAIAPGGGDVVVPRPGFPNDTAGGLNFDAFEWAPNSSVIAYVADQLVDNTFELFTVPPDGSALPTEVSAISGSPFDVLEFKWAPNSSRVAYRADQNTEEVYELYTATPDGSDNDRVSGALAVGGDVLEFDWAPDSLRIAYNADQDTNDIFELYTSPPDSNAPNPKLNPNTYVFGQNVTVFDWAPDSSLIAYLADQDIDGVNELYTSPPDGNTPNSKLNPDFAVTPPPQERVSSFEWAPDSTRVAYLANQLTNTVFELFSALPDGSVNDMVSGSLQANGIVFEFAWAPDTSRIAYRADQDFDTVDELYSSQPDGSGNGKISGPIIPNGAVLLGFAYEP